MSSEAPGAYPVKDGWLGLEAPRYTSYPSAHHFLPVIGADHHAGFLSELTPDTSVSAYVHIPFCRELCWFCGCHTKMTKRYAPVASYVRLLLKEIEIIGQKAGRRGRLVNIHFGGGSPSLLEAKDLLAILYALAEAFEHHPPGELAIELDPRTTTPENAALYASLGFNRVSIGIQDFNEEVQRAINRVQPYEMVASVVRNLRNSGIQDINCDLVYGLPFQTEARFLATLEQTLSLQPSRIALFSYAHMPQVKKHQRLIQDDWLPTPMEKLELYRLARETLEANGYVTVGIDHFARPEDPLARAMRNGSLRRNFQGYVVDDSDVVIGIGSSAISQFPGGYVQNDASTPEYGKRIGQGKLASIRGWGFTGDDSVRKHVIDALMCFLSVDIGETCHRFDLDEGYFAPELQELQTGPYREIVTTQGGRLCVITPHRMAARVVASVFDRYRGTALSRYSKVA